MKNVKYNDLRDMEYRFQQTYGEIINIFDLKYIPTIKTDYSLNPIIYQIGDINKTLKDVLPSNVKYSVSIDEKILKSNLKINQTLIFIKKSFFYTVLVFTRPHS